VLDVSGSMEEAAATCRNIKDNPALAGTKVIAAGDGLSPQSQQWLRQQGFDQCTSKQYTPARLAEAVGEP
jgi:CheY-like chemotaxis protein